MFRRSAALIVSLCLITFLVPRAGLAQVNSNTSNIVLSAPLLESITVAGTPSTVTFALAGSGTASGSTAVSITTVWVLTAARTNIKLYGYFSSASAALTDGSGHNIPSSAVSGSVNSGSFTAFTSNTPYSTGSGLQLFSQNVSGVTLNSNRTDSLALQIDTVGLNLPAATYTGTLVLEAQAN